MAIADLAFWLVLEMADKKVSMRGDVQCYEPDPKRQHLPLFDDDKKQTWFQSVEDRIKGLQRVPMNN